MGHDTSFANLWKQQHGKQHTNSKGMTFSNVGGVGWVGKCIEPMHTDIEVKFAIVLLVSSVPSL